MDPDFVFIVQYECPRCRTRLEDRSSGLPTWQRCPSCGRVGLPPEHQQRERVLMTADSGSVPLTGSFSTGGASLPLRPRSMAPLPPPTTSRSPNLRILLGLGFFVSMFLGVFSLLDSNPSLSSIAGLASLAFLVLFFVAAGGPSSD